jgi:hypothetical protein
LKRFVLRSFENSLTHSLKKKPKFVKKTKIQTLITNFFKTATQNKQ